MAGATEYVLAEMIGGPLDGETRVLRSDTLVMYVPLSNAPRAGIVAIGTQTRAVHPPRLGRYAQGLPMTTVTIEAWLDVAPIALDAALIARDTAVRIALGDRTTPYDWAGE